MEETRKFTLEEVQRMMQGDAKVTEEEGHFCAWTHEWNDKRLCLTFPKVLPLQSPLKPFIPLGTTCDGDRLMDDLLKEYRHFIVNMLLGSRYDGGSEGDVYFSAHVDDPQDAVLVIDWLGDTPPHESVMERLQATLVARTMDEDGDTNQDVLVVPAAVIPCQLIEQAQWKDRALQRKLRADRREYDLHKGYYRHEMTKLLEDVECQVWDYIFGDDIVDVRLKPEIWEKMAMMVPPTVMDPMKNLKLEYTKEGVVTLGKHLLHGALMEPMVLQVLNRS